MIEVSEAKESLSEAGMATKVSDKLLKCGSRILGFSLIYLKLSFADEGISCGD